MRLEIAGIVLSMFDRLNNAYGTCYDPKSGVAEINVPDLGPKSLDISSDDIEGFSGAIAAFDPDEKLDLIETVEKTLERVTVKDVTCIRFRTSLDKGSRAVVIVESEWSEFTRWWSAVAEKTPDLVERYAAAVEAANADPPTE